MAIPTSYLTSTKNVSGILEQIQRGGIPPKFNYEHLKEMGFKSSADRPIIPILKALKFVTDAGEPTERYRRFKEKRNAKEVLGEAMQEAYADVFRIDEGAPKLGAEELKGIFARLSGKSDSVADKMALTFRALAEHANFEAAPPESAEAPEPEPEKKPHTERATHDSSGAGIDLHHDVHIHLPVSTDVKVYDAIFQSLRDNLMP